MHGVAAFVGAEKRSGDGDQIVALNLCHLQGFRCVRDPDHIAPFQCEFQGLKVGDAPAEFHRQTEWWHSPQIFPR